MNESKWTIPLLQYGVGSFSLKLSDSSGTLKELCTKGTIVKFYADHDHSDTLQFWGRIDYPKGSLKKEGRFIEVIGRHRCFFLSERKVCLSADREDPGRILTDICTLYVPEVTTTGVNNVGIELNGCEATTGWSTSHCNVATSTTKKRGTYGLSITHDGTLYASYALVGVTPDFDITSNSLLLWIYIKDQTMLDKIGYGTDQTCFMIAAVDSGASKIASWYIYKTDLKIGWNRIECIRNQGDYSEGSGMDVTACDQFRIYTYAIADATTWTAGDLVIDDVWLCPTAKVMSKEWNYTPFTECVKDICERAIFDARIDNDLDIDFFDRNSILIETEAIVESDNYIDSDEFGQDDYYERTRVTAMGQTDDGQPIIYTAISGVDNTENDPEAADGIREVFIKNPSANTLQKVKDLAQATLIGYVNRPAQGTIKSHGLQIVKPGDNLWLVVPRQEIYLPYRIVTMSHTFGTSQGFWKTDCTFEEELKSTDLLINQAYRKIEERTEAENPNKMNFSYPVTFDDDVLTESHSNTQVIDGKLNLVTPATGTGTWISVVHAATVDVTKIEYRWNGKDLGASRFYYSTDGGVNWTQITRQKEQYDVPAAQQTRSLQIKVEFFADSLNVNPELDSIVGMYV